MATKIRSKKTRSAKRIAPISRHRQRRAGGINEERKLGLRSALGMTRETFGRLVSVSPRKLADVESDPEKAAKFRRNRNYVQAKRLHDALSEVVDPACLGEWFNTPNEAFGEFKPIELIERGDIDRLWEMVYRLRSGMPG